MDLMNIAVSIFGVKTERIHFRSVRRHTAVASVILFHSIKEGASCKFLIIHLQDLFIQFFAKRS